MKIDQIRTTPVNIPFEQPLIWSRGIYPGTSKTVVEVITDEGIVGLGKAPTAADAEYIRKELAVESTASALP